METKTLYALQLKAAFVGVRTMLGINEDNAIIKMNSFINSHNIKMFMSPARHWHISLEWEPSWLNALKYAIKMKIHSKFATTGTSIASACSYVRCGKK